MKQDKQNGVWDRQETRVVRPFRSAGEYLSDSKLRLLTDGEFFDGPLIVQNERIDRDCLGLSLRVSQAPKNFQDLVGLPLEELALVVSIEDRMFKKADVVYTVPLAKVESGVIELDDGVQDAFSWAAEMRVHVSVVVVRDREHRSGVASRAGNWLAKKTFNIRKPIDSATFHIDAVPGEYFTKRGLPSTTTYFVEILDPDLNQPCDAIPQLVKVSILDEVHSALARTDDSVVGKALVRAIYVDVVATILSAGFENLGDGEVEPDSAMDVVCRRLTKATGVSGVLLRKYAREKGCPQLRATIQTDAMLGRVILAAATRRTI